MKLRNKMVTYIQIHEVFQNQTLQIITGIVKSFPVLAMELLTSMEPVQGSKLEAAS